MAKQLDKHPTTFIHGSSMRRTMDETPRLHAQQTTRPQPKTLTTKEKGELLEMFRSLEKASFESIIEQLKNGDEKRKVIDKAWLKLLGYKGDPETFLTQLYRAISEEIKIIGQMMQ